MSAHQLSSRGALTAVPGIAAAITFGISDVLVKLVLLSGCDPLTMASFRSVISLPFLALWLRIGPKPAADARVRWASMGIGLLFAVIVLSLYKSIELIDVPTAILTYFAYPLLTGIVASLAGLETLRWRGGVCAVAAFCGLAVMIGAHPAGLAFAGVAFALGAACCRTAYLLATRAFLAGADVRLMTWYSVVSSTAVFVVVSFGTQTWNGPQTTAGWATLVGLALTTTASVVFIFMSTQRIGPFRTALIMHIEPLVVMLLSALLLDELITPIQGVGSAIMLAALVAFQLWR